MEARKRMPWSPKNSIRQGSGSPFGCLGEVVAADFFGVPLEPTRDYDIIIPAYDESLRLIGRAKVDVKTKDRNVPPDPEKHDATVSDYNTQQKAHLYLFASTQKPHRFSSFYDTHSCYLIGFGRKDEVFADANFRRKGTTDPNASARQIASGTGVYLCDCHSVNYSLLKTRVRDDAKLVLTQADVDYFIASGMPLLPPE